MFELSFYKWAGNKITKKVTRDRVTLQEVIGAVRQERGMTSNFITIRSNMVHYIRARVAADVKGDHINMCIHIAAWICDLEDHGVR